MRLIDANKLNATIEQLGNLKGRTDMVTQEWARGWDAAVTMVGKIIEDATTIDDAWLRDTHTAIKNAQIMAMLAIQKAEKISQWIPVTEHLPTNDETVLVTWRNKKGASSVNRAYYRNETWHGSGSMADVIAWRPIPEPWEGGCDI